MIESPFDCYRLAVVLFVVSHCGVLAAAWGWKRAADRRSAEAERRPGRTSIAMRACLGQYRRDLIEIVALTTVLAVLVLFHWRSG